MTRRLGCSKTNNKPPDCSTCENKRYLVCRRDDAFLAIERCDTCVPYELDDEEAAKLAQQDGIKCKDTYPCYLIDYEDPSMWEPANK